MPKLVKQHFGIYDLEYDGNDLDEVLKETQDEYDEEEDPDYGDPFHVADDELCYEEAVYGDYVVIGNLK